MVVREIQIWIPLLSSLENSQWDSLRFTESRVMKAELEVMKEHSLYTPYFNFSERVIEN